jgi:hypothetical protein
VLCIFDFYLVFTRWTSVSFDELGKRDQYFFFLAAVLAENQILKTAGTDAVIGLEGVVTIKASKDLSDCFFVTVKIGADQSPFWASLDIMSRDFPIDIGAKGKDLSSAYGTEIVRDSFLLQNFYQQRIFIFWNFKVEIGQRDFKRRFYPSFLAVNTK